jgi:hypothetical protein
MYGQQNPYSQYPYTGYTYPNYGNRQFMQPQQQMAQPQMQQQVQPQYETPIQDIRFVTSEEAKAFIVMPNSKALLIDKNSGVAHLKTATIWVNPLRNTLSLNKSMRTALRLNRKNPLRRWTTRNS